MFADPAGSDASFLTASEVTLELLSGALSGSAKAGFLIGSGGSIAQNAPCFTFQRFCMTFSPKASGSPATSSHF